MTDAVFGERLNAVFLTSSNVQHQNAPRVSRPNIAMAIIFARAKAASVQLTFLTDKWMW
jgi:hypothetical protein